MVNITLFHNVTILSMENCLAVIKINYNSKLNDLNSIAKLLTAYSDDGFDSELYMCGCTIIAFYSHMLHIL